MGISPIITESLQVYKNLLYKHHEQLQEIRAIENFSDADVTVEQGSTKKSVVVTDLVTVVNAMSKLYMVCTIA